MHSPMQILPRRPRIEPDWVDTGSSTQVENCLENREFTHPWILFLYFRKRYAMVDKSFRLNLFTISTLLTSMTSSYDHSSILPIDANLRYSVLSMWFRDGIPDERLPYDSVWLTFGNWLNLCNVGLLIGVLLTVQVRC